MAETALRESGDGEDPRQPGDGQARRERPGPAGRDRLRIRPRPARMAGLSVTAELQTRVQAPALRRAGRRPGLLVVSATDGEDTALTSRGPLPDPPCAPERAVFESGSITKVFTSLLLALAVERGELGVDDPLVEHLPRGTPRADARMVDRSGSLDLSTHRSGLPRLPPGSSCSRSAIATIPTPASRRMTSKQRLGRPVRRVAGADDPATGVLPAPVCWASRSPTRPRPTTKPWCGSGSPAPLGLQDTVITLSEDHRSRLGLGNEGMGRCRQASGRSPASTKAAPRSHRRRPAHVHPRPDGDAAGRARGARPRSDRATRREQRAVASPRGCGSPRMAPGRDRSSEGPGRDAQRWDRRLSEHRGLGAGRAAWRRGAFGERSKRGRGRHGSSSSTSNDPPVLPSRGRGRSTPPRARGRAVPRGTAPRDSRMRRR